MTGHGRPFRFLAIVIAGWTGVRVAMLWPQIDEPADLVRAVMPMPPAAPIAAAPPSPAPVRPAAAIAHNAPSYLSAQSSSATAEPDLRTFALLNMVHFGPPEPLAPTFGGPIMALAPAAFAREVAASRWSASLWVLARDGGGRAGTGGPLLGGGQAGARLVYALTPALAAVGRVSTPLAGRGREAAVGIEWRPGRLPVRLVAEQRFAIDGGAAPTPVLGAVGGVYGVPVVADFSLEGYAQAGLIARDGVSGFVDAIARVTRSLRDRPVRLDAGVGAWASAQRGAARLDLGPTAGISVPIAGKALRVTADWRERIAGDARPASGPAMTVGVDF